MPSNSIFGFLKFLYLLEKITNLLNFILRKQAHLLHKAVLNLCDEGAGLVAVILDFCGFAWAFCCSA